MNTTPDKKLTPMAELIELIDRQKGHIWSEGKKYLLIAEEDCKRWRLEAEREYASQQAPEGMYTKEQIEAAFTAGMNYEYGNHFGAVPNSHMNKQEFIRSLKH